MPEKSWSIIVVVILVIGIALAVGNSVFNKTGSQDEVVENPEKINSSENALTQNVQGLQEKLQQGEEGLLPQNSDLFTHPNQQSQTGQSKSQKRYQKFPGELPSSQLMNKKAVIETDKGVIEFEIYPEATKAASNFIFLSNDGFYNGLTFHRVEPGFVVQGGDPNGDGSGGPGYTFTEDKVEGSYTKGTVAMAKRLNEPAGTGGSQFFIMLEDHHLPLEYVIFGKVIKGMDVVEKIRVGDVMRKVFIVDLNE